MESLEIKVEHDGIDIFYEQRTNKWRFELRGRERHVDSLQAAIDAIDKPDPKEKKAFTPIQVWFLEHHRGKFETARITSIADTTSFNGSTQVWVLARDGKRSKESVTSLFSHTQENQAKMAEWVRINDEIGRLIKLREESYRSLENVKKQVDSAI